MNSLKTLAALSAMAISLGAAAEGYVPSPQVVESQKEFSADRFGIFIHWGIYSMFGQGEWYLNYGPKADEYAKAAKGFYPIDFNADEWAEAFKDAGAGYVTFTSRHHDGFSMFDTEASDYNQSSDVRGCHAAHGNAVETHPRTGWYRRQRGIPARLAISAAYRHR